MLYFSRWKVIAILLSVLAGILCALPNILPKDIQDTLRERTILRPITLGLDLQGGSNVLMEVDRKELVDTLIVQQMGDVPPALPTSSTERQAASRCRSPRLAMSTRQMTP